MLPVVKVYGYLAGAFGRTATGEAAAVGEAHIMVFVTRVCTYDAYSIITDQPTCVAVIPFLRSQLLCDGGCAQILVWRWFVLLGNTLICMT